MLKMFEQCPACGGPLVITECRCANCQLRMQGEFQPGLFSKLSEDQLTFVRAFLRVRGNLSEMEKVLGVSYPTIRNKLDEVNKALDAVDAPPVTQRGNGDQVPPPAASSSDEARRAILAQVASGELTAAEAVQKLQNLKGDK